MFEGLFVRALRVERQSDFALELKQAGYDLETPQLSYDGTVWAACLELAAKRFYPDLSIYDAWRSLGRRFIRGYFETLIGRAISVVLPWMRPARFMELGPHFLRTGLAGGTCEVDFPAPGQAVVRLTGPHEGTAFVLSGVIEECFVRMRVDGIFTPSVANGIEGRIEVQWSPTGRLDSAAQRR